MAYLTGRRQRKWKAYWKGLDNSQSKNCNFDTIELKCRAHSNHVIISSWWPALALISRPGTLQAIDQTRYVLVIGTVDMHFSADIFFSTCVQRTNFHTKVKHLVLVQKTQLLAYNILVKMLNIGSSAVQMFFRKETMDNHLRYLQFKATNKMTQNSRSLWLIFVSFAFHMLFWSLMSFKDMHSKQNTLI